MTVKQQQIVSFLREFSRWAASQSDILGVVLVGSYARNEAADASDVDLVIVARKPKTYLSDTRWVQCFGTVNRQQIEHYGKVASLRVWYMDSQEVEYGFADETWSSLPIDQGTKKVISDGMKILFERESRLSRLKEPNSMAECESPSLSGHRL